MLKATVIFLIGALISGSAMWAAIYETPAEIFLRINAGTALMICSLFLIVRA